MGRFTWLSGPKPCILERTHWDICQILEHEHCCWWSSPALDFSSFVWSSILLQSFPLWTPANRQNNWRFSTSAASLWSKTTHGLKGRISSLGRSLVRAPQQVTSTLNEHMGLSAWLHNSRQYALTNAASPRSCDGNRRAHLASGTLSWHQSTVNHCALRYSFSRCNKSQFEFQWKLYI